MRKSLAECAGNMALCQLRANNAGTFFTMAIQEMRQGGTQYDIYP
jgi:hypothetical protein